MIINPQETVKASADGLKLWFSVLVPALLPFFIVSELMVNLGFVHFLGVVLEPIMRPVFKLPGCSSLVIAMGFTSGFPVGAILSRKLYEDNLLTANETERLVSFTNNSSPLFILGAVGVGMFGSPAIGYLLAASHYISNLLVGILWRSRARKSPWVDKPNRGLLKRGFAALIESQKSNNQSVGTMISGAIKNSLNNILAISGFIIVFSIITRMFTVWGIMDILAKLLINVFASLNITYQLAYGLGMGIFEITLGANTVTFSSQAPLLHQLIIVSIIMGFSGLSVITQVMSIMAGTPVRLSFYLLSRFIQMILSIVITYSGYHLFIKSLQPITTFSIPYYKIMYSLHAWSISLYCLIAAVLIIAILLIIRLLCNN
jgi:sporulation integral membrane protein YlbJ